MMFWDSHGSIALFCIFKYFQGRSFCTEIWNSEIGRTRNASCPAPAAASSQTRETALGFLSLGRAWGDLVTDVHRDWGLPAGVSR